VTTKPVVVGDTEARAYLQSNKLPSFSKGTLKLEHK